MKKTLSKSMLFILWIFLSLHLVAESFKINQATAYFTDSLISRNDHVVSSYSFKPQDKIRFLVTKLEYVTHVKSDDKYVSISNEDVILQASNSSLKVYPRFQLEDTGSTARSAEYISHYKVDSGVQLIRWFVFSVPKNAKNFKLKIKGFSEVKVKVDQSLKKSKEKESILQRLKKCELVSLKKLSEFKSYYTFFQNKKSLTHQTSTALKKGQLYEVLLKLEVKGQGRSFFIGSPALALRDNSTASVYPFICDYSGTVNPSISRGGENAAWPELRDYKLIFYGPKACKDFSILYHGEEIASWKEAK